VSRHTTSVGDSRPLEQSIATMDTTTIPDRNKPGHLPKLLARLRDGAFVTRQDRCGRALHRLAYRRETDLLAEIIQNILGESFTEAKEISANWLLHRQISQRCWHSMAYSSFSRVRKTALDSLFPHKHQVVRYIDNCKRGVLIASIHMGDYLNGLLNLCLSASSGKEVFILRDREWDQQEDRVFKKFGVAGARVTVLRRQGNVALSALRQLRRGNIVVALYDLPRQWGSTTRVTFFDHQMSLVRGPAELAILAEADILPIMFHYGVDGSRIIDSFPVYRPPSHTRASLATSVQEITQHLIAQAERQIGQFPGQWHHWNLLPAMLADD
jgi:lauroyl/myristoyl acyltransferase